MVTTKQLVHAALWLVVALGAVAGCYLLLTAEFVAWVQVLIYVGAVVVLLLFGLMLTRAPIGRLRRPRPDRRCSGPPRRSSPLGLAGVVVVAVVDAFRATHDRRRRRPAAAPPSVAGTALFRAWVLPFEVLSVLLLAALVGAIVLSRRDIGPADGEGDPAGGR